MNLNLIVSQDPEVMHGELVFAGTRVPVQSLVDHLKAGDRLEDFLEGFPSVTHSQAQALLELLFTTFEMKFSDANSYRRTTRPQTQTAIFA